MVNFNQITAPSQKKKKKKKNQITASILLRWDDMVQRATHAFCVSEFLDNNKEL